MQLNKWELHFIIYLTIPMEAHVRTKRIYHALMWSTLHILLGRPNIHSILPPRDTIDAVITCVSPVYIWEENTITIESVTCLVIQDEDSQEPDTSWRNGLHYFLWHGGRIAGQRLMAH